ncbi:MAG: radical SAM protein [Phycisphaeraceae bacterium]|nr:radical SAM protein [Phycisphaeraceae bacterium]
MAVNKLYWSSMSLPVIQPSRVTIMIKPVGALCNLDCTYCYYLPTKAIYERHEHRMSLKTLEEIFACILPRFANEVTVAWQGGEPTLAGLDFFKSAMEFQRRYLRAGQRVNNALQTNGTLLTDDWCQFLKKEDFLIGLSVDGPPRFHDHYRLGHRGQGSSDEVMRGFKLLRQHGVEHNILCVLNDHNVKHPDEIFGYLMNLGARWLQFIPAIEWVKDTSSGTAGKNNVLAPFAPSPRAYGEFLCRVFDRWFQKHRHTVSVRIFDAVLNKLVLGQTPFCILDGSCHGQLTIEHDGAVFGCDHFVERRWQLGQIGQPDWQNSIGVDDVAVNSDQVGITVHGRGFIKHKSIDEKNIESERDLSEAVLTGSVREDSSESSAFPAGGTSGGGQFDLKWFDRLEQGRLGVFAGRKQSLPAKCLSCQWKPYCHGGCPKHRSMGGEVPEATVLCESYMMFFAHAMPRLQWLADYLRKGMQPPLPEEVETPGGKKGLDKSKLTYEKALAAARAAMERTT